MKNYFRAVIALFVVCLLSLNLTAQEKSKVREQIAKNEAEKTEIKSEKAATRFIEGKKEYSEILPDDSYLVELAANVEVGHLHTMTSCTSFHKPTNDVICSITQETAFGSGKQMVSHTTPLSFLDSNRVSGVGDVTLTYRYQLTNDKNWAVVSPRVSLIIPSGKKDKGLGLGSTGLQFNLPVSKRLSNSFLATFNAGMTFFPRFKGEDSSGNLVKKQLANYNLGGSLVWVAHRNVNPLIEYVENFAGEIGEDGQVKRLNEHIISPGVGLAWKFKSVRVSPGFAVPMSFCQGERRTGIFFYLAFDHLLFKNGEKK